VLRLLPVLVAVFACEFAPPAPEATFDCTSDAPGCPPGQLCILADNRDGRGRCALDTTLDAACTRRDDVEPGIVRLLDDGTACGPVAAEANACIAGVCVALDCGDPARPAACGNGCVELGERCDDGGRDDGDGCSQSCQVENGWECPGAPSGCAPICGDGRVVGTERCDDGVANPADGCDASCQPTRFVVDRFIDGSPDGVSARTMPLDLPLGIAADADGVLYIADSRNHRVLRFDPRLERRRGNHGTGPADIVVIAGTGAGGFSGDDGPARAAELCVPTSVAVDAAGNVFIADAMNHRIRRVDRSGVITTIAGSASTGDTCGQSSGGRDDDDVAHDARAAQLSTPLAIAVEPRRGDIYVLDAGNQRVRRLWQVPTGGGSCDEGQQTGEPPSGTPGCWKMRTVLGTAAEPGVTPPTVFHGRDVRFGDGGQSDFVNLGVFIQFGPMALGLTPAGDLIVADTFNHGLVHVDAACIAPACTEDGECGGCEAGFTRLGATLALPLAVHALPDGRVVVADFTNRQVMVDGRPIVRAGADVRTMLGEPAAQFDAPGPLASVGDQLFILEPNLNRLTRLSLTATPGVPRVLEQLIGGSPVGPIGPVQDDATETPLFQPGQLALDSSGQLHVMDTLQLVVRRYATAADGSVRAAVVAGDGKANLLELFAPGASVQAGRCTDDPSLAASFGSYPQGMAILRGETGDTILIADVVRQRVIRFDTDGRLCEVLTAGDVGRNFEPEFLHLRDRTLTVIDENAGSSARLVRVTLDEAGDPVEGTLALVEIPRRPNLAHDFVRIHDAVPFDDPTTLEAEDQTLLADPQHRVVWRYDHRSGVLDPWVGEPALLGSAPVNDGGSAARADARLLRPAGLAVCPDGRVVIADLGCRGEEVWTPTGCRVVDDEHGAPRDAGVRLRVVGPDGARVETLAGTGVRAISGDHGPATAAGVALTKVDELALGLVCRDDGSVFFSEIDGNRVRIITADGTITTYAGRTAPPGPAPSPGFARLYGPTSFASHLPATPPPALLVVDGAVQPGRAGATLTDDDGAGRVLFVDATAGVRVAVGYERAHVEADRPLARLAPLLLGARGAVWDTWVPDAPRLVVTQSESTAIRSFTLGGAAIGSPDSLELPEKRFDSDALRGLAGIAIDPRDGTFAVVDSDDNCVRRLSRDLADAGVLFGTCDPASAGAGEHALREPTHIAFSAAGVLFVADTGNHRVVRIDGSGVGAVARVVVGNGDEASAGEGAPAYRQAVRSPRQIVFDRWQNLYVASTTTVRVVLNRDGDDDGPDGDEPVISAFGADRRSYPESDANCVEALALAPANVRAPGAYGPAVVVGDSCLGTAALLSLRAIRAGEGESEAGGSGEAEEPP
jgi:cysteine-rich repeat protein